jgi:methylmalonyl-CoA/ethylmalonyl-CoA epimerase
MSPLLAFSCDSEDPALEDLMSQSALKLGHIAIAVESLEKAEDAVKKVFGLSLSPIEEVASQKVRVRFVDLGGVRFEFLEPTASDSPISKFIEKRGGGVHHVSFEVSDLETRLKNLKSSQVRLINESPVPGAEGCDVAFLHPASFMGVLVELMQKPH